MAPSWTHLKLLNLHANDVTIDIMQIIIVAVKFYKRYEI